MSSNGSWGYVVSVACESSMWPCRRAVLPLSRFDAEARSWIYLVDKCTGCMTKKQRSGASPSCSAGIWDCTQFQCSLTVFTAPGVHERYSRGGLRMTIFTALDGSFFFLAQGPKEPIPTKVQTLTLFYSQQTKANTHRKNSQFELICDLRLQFSNRHESAFL